MKCKYCNTEIVGKADFCPLCKKPLVQDEIVEEQNKDYIYPIKKKRSKAYKILTFTPMYFIVASVVFLIVTIVNIMLAPEMPWYLLVGVALLYVYILVQNTILSRNSIVSKILWQALLVFAFLWVIGFMLFNMGVIEKIWVFVFDYTLPTVVGISNLVMCILTACFVKKDKGLIVDAICFSFTGFLPLILYGAGFGLISYPSVAVAILSLVQIVVFLIIGRKNLKSEGKLKYRA